jgi:hypothetical protein
MCGDAPARAYLPTARYLIIGETLNALVVPPQYLHVTAGIHLLRVVRGGELVCEWVMMLPAENAACIRST